ncbi:MAG: PilZ domain-containing protein [Spirochaetes bacterium]|nr:PilZ domain-containing protein [Spirochaetota bacterium]
MSIITSHEISRFYEEYQQTEVTFNKQVMEATGLLSTHLKAAGGETRCVLYACSMAAAKLLVPDLREPFLQAIQKAGGHLSVRLTFKRPEKPDPLTFYVAGRLTGTTPYNPQNPSAQLVALEFTGRPSDDLIQALGVLLEANTNAQRRREERITMTPDALKRLGIESPSTIVVEGADTRCILRDLSFGGAKVLVANLTVSVAGQPIGLKVKRNEGDETITLWGEVARAEEVSGHPEFLALGIKFLGDPPVVYKMMLSGFLSGGRRILPAGPAAGKPGATRRPAP